MANNIWSNYTEKTATPVDADEVMVRDSTDGKNKRLLFGTFWKWVAKKLNEATISELQTSNKTIVGALNQLNSETSTVTNTKYFDSGTDFHNIPDGLYSFNTNTYGTINTEYMLPPIEKIGDGILIAKTYSKYQTICCIGYKGIAIIQKDINTNNFLTGAWNVLAKL